MCWQCPYWAFIQRVDLLGKEGLCSPSCGLVLEIEIKKKAKEGLRNYERLEKVLQKPSVTDSELQKILKKIKKTNNYMERDYMAETVMDSLSGIEYTLRPSIYKVHEDRASELLDVAEQGKVMLYGIAVGADEITQLAKETIIRYAEEHPLKQKEERHGSK